MARIKKELTELIGGTPLLELSRLSKKHDAKAQIIAKLEYFNPGGSVKDRIALAMIEDAEAKGILKPGAVIIEPTSGNTGVGLAMVAAVRGYRLILTMPETMSAERRKLLARIGSRDRPHPGERRNGRSGEKGRSTASRNPGFGHPPAVFQPGQSGSTTYKPQQKKYGTTQTEKWTSS